MKKITKIALALAASVFVGAAFVGCAEEEGTTGSIGKDFELDNTKYISEYAGHAVGDDNTTSYLRGYRSLKTKHTGGVAYITLEDASSCSDNNGAGMVGFVFGIQDTKDKKGESATGTTFGVVGIRRNKNNSTSYYISWVENCQLSEDGKDGYSDNGSFTDPDGNVIREKGPQTNVTSLGITATAGAPLYVAVEVLADGPDTDGDGIVEEKEGNGGYVINIYKATKDAEGNFAKGDKIVSGKKIDSSFTGDIVAAQYDLGLYTSVYPGQILKGRIDLPSAELVNECMVYYGEE